MPTGRDLIEARLKHARGEGEKPEAEVSILLLGDDQAIFRVFEVDVTDDARGLLASVSVTMDGATPTCTALNLRRVDGEALTGADLRSLPLRRWIERAVAEASFPLAPGTPIFGAPASTQRRSIDDDHLREVARIYRAALAADRRDPTKAVAEELKLGARTAGRHVKQARNRGFLGEALDRRPGEKAGRSRKRKR